MGGHQPVLGPPSPTHNPQGQSFCCAILPFVLKSVPEDNGDLPSPSHLPPAPNITIFTRNSCDRLRVTLKARPYKRREWGEPLDSWENVSPFSVEGWLKGGSIHAAVGSLRTSSGRRACFGVTHAPLSRCSPCPVGRHSECLVQQAGCGGIFTLVYCGCPAWGE